MSLGWLDTENKVFSLTMCVKSLSWDGGVVVLLLPGLRNAGSGPASPIVPTGTGNLSFGNRSGLSKLNPWALLEKWCNAFLNYVNRCDAEGIFEPV